MTSSSPSRIFVLSLLGVLGFSTLALICIYWNIYGYAKMFGDFTVFHDAARHTVMGQWKDIYDIDRLRSVVRSGIGNAGLSFFLNPPTGLLLIYPLGFLATIPALVLWNIVQFALLYCVIRTDYMQRLFAPSATPAVGTNSLLVITFAAFSLQNILYGQVAVFCTILFLLVLIWRKSHPILAGIMLGIFSFKPQLGLLLPVLLIMEKNWISLFCAVLTASAMVGFSLLIFGTGLWQDYYEAVATLRHFLAQDQSTLFMMTISANAALRNLGLPAMAAIVCQGFVTLITLGFIWPVLKRGRESDKILMLTYATYLVTPYALIYDTPLLAIPCAWWLRRAEEDRITKPELIALLLLVLFPLVALLLQIDHIPYSVIAIGLGLIVARIVAKPSLQRIS